MTDNEPWVMVADRTARAFTRSNPLVELDDVMQVARLGAWKAWHQWQPGGMGRTDFVRTRAWFAIVDMLRASGGYGCELGRHTYKQGGRRRTVELTSSATPVTDSHENQAVTACDLARALERIPPREATVVTLVDLEGHLQEDVATAMGVTHGRVSQIRRQALDRLRPLLAA